MEHSQTILPPVDPQTQVDTLTVPVNHQLQSLLSRLIFWSRFVGIVSFIAGILSCLGIVTLFIPAVIVGIFLIIMGFRLITAASSFRDVLNNKNPAALIRALANLRLYVFMNGLLLILSIALIAAIIIGVFTFGNWFWKIWHEEINYFVWIVL